MFGEILSRFSIFWWFSVELAVVDRVLRATMLVVGAVVFERVEDGICDEETAIFCKFSLVVPIS